MQRLLFQALNKKEHKGPGGPDSPGGGDSDGEGEPTLTPRTEAKFNKIDEEFQLMMHRNNVNGGKVSFLSLLCLHYVFFSEGVS